MAGLIWLWNVQMLPDPTPGQSWLLAMAQQDRRIRLDPMRVAIHAVGAGVVL